MNTVGASPAKANSSPDGGNGLPNLTPTSGDVFNLAETSAPREAEELRKDWKRQSPEARGGDAFVAE